MEKDGIVMPTTMKDIAKKAGVSVTTISKIFNNRDMNISEATKQRVYEIAEELNYVPNSVAKSLRMKTSYMIGVVLDDISDPFYSLYMRGIVETASKNNFGVLFSSAKVNIGDETKSEGDNQAGAIRFMSSRMVDGIILDKLASSSSREAILSAKCPITAYLDEGNIENLNVGQVYVDTKAAIRDAANLLIQKGCKRIAFISSNIKNYKERLEGYKDALSENGFPYEEALVYEKDFDANTGKEGLEAVLKQKVDGVVCGNDRIAIGVLDEAARRGIKVPKELKVIGLDDLWMSQFTTPTLTTVHQPIYQMGAEAAQMLIDNINDGTPLLRKKLDYHIVMRESV